MAKGAHKGCGCVSVIVALVVVLCIGFAAGGESSGESTSASRDGLAAASASAQEAVPSDRVASQPRATAASAADSGAPLAAGAAAAPAPAASAAQATDAASGILTVSYLDVGQGDSELLQFPDGRTMLIDAGTPEAAGTVVGDLRARGVTHIDWLVATHPHADHIGGMASVISSFDIGEVWAPRATTNTQTFEGFLDALDAKGLQINAGSAGACIADATDAGYAISILGPAADVSSDDLNDYSLVIRVDFGATSFLFTGDAPASEILADQPGHVDVLKVAHHGSDTGTTAALATALSPAIAVISYGVGNDYGHPTQETLDELAGCGAQVLGTGANGTVTVTSDGSSVSASCEKAGTVVAGGGGTQAATGGTAAAAPEQPAAPAAGVTQAQTPAAADDQSQTVYVTPTGAKYHRAGCRMLNKPGGGRAISKADAIAQGYEPCGICNP